MRLKSLTKRQREIYDWIAGFIKSHGYSPSFDEIGAGLGLSSLATVHKHLTNLERKCYIHRDYNRSRSISLGAKHKVYFSCAGCGKQNEVAL